MLHCVVLNNCLKNVNISSIFCGQSLKSLGHASSTQAQTLRDLEISLRTNHIE